MMAVAKFYSRGLPVVFSPLPSGYLAESLPLRG